MARLRRILRAWCVLRPDYGYAQAMNFSAAVTLWVAGHDEAKAFSLFVALVHRLPTDFYAETPPLRGFQVELSTLTTLLDDMMPTLLNAADGALREALPLVACKWFLNLFVDTLPLPLLLAVWDLILMTPPAAPDGAAGASLLKEPPSAAVAPTTESVPDGTDSKASFGVSDFDVAIHSECVAVAGLPPTDVLLRVSLILLGMHEDQILHALSTSAPARIILLQ